jgi:RNA polymerase sigma-70 factor, ECF subfamily
MSFFMDGVLLGSWEDAPFNINVRIWRNLSGNSREIFSCDLLRFRSLAIITRVEDRPDGIPAPPASDVQGLFITHIDLIRGFIRALVRDRHLADDVLQETFLTVSRKSAAFEPGTNFPRWACAVARLKVLEALRREKRSLRFLSEDAIEALAASHVAPEQARRAEILDSCIACLPPAMKRSVELRYAGDHKPAEIARIIGWTVEAVYVTLSRARHLLRECIERKLLETGDRP